MSSKKNPFSKRRVVIFLLSVLAGVYWVIGNVADVYNIGILGAVYEILWLPMIILVFALPLAAFGLWVKDKFSLGSLYLYTFLIGLATVLWLLLKN